jgi:hypothetical protein
MECKPQRRCDYDYVNNNNNNNNNNKTNGTECCNMKPVSKMVLGRYSSSFSGKLTVCNFTVNCWYKAKYFGFKTKSTSS